MLTIDTRDTRIYPIMILLAIAAGVALQYRLNTQRGIQKHIAGIAVLSGIFCSLCGGMLLTLITSGWQYFGLSSLGGLAGLYAGNALVAVFARRPYYLNILTQDCTLVLPLMYSISKIGCFGAGCCRGIGYHGPGAVCYVTETGTDTVLPVQLLETLGFGAIFVMGMILFRQKRRNTVHLLFVVSLIAKFALDFLRESHLQEILSQTQIFCLVLLLLDIVLLIRKRKQQHTAF